MNEIESAQFMWDSTARRHYENALRRLSDVHERVGYMLKTLEKVDPADLHGSVAAPTSSDARNVIGDLVEVAQRLELLDLLRDFQPVYRPSAPSEIKP
jgi:hypothetical protein